MTLKSVVNRTCSLLQLAFFRQHNCDISDAQLKYKSRAAQLYRDKLSHNATQALRLHGTKVNVVLLRYLGWYAEFLLKIELEFFFLR